MPHTKYLPKGIPIILQAMVRTDNTASLPHDHYGESCVIRVIPGTDYSLCIIHDVQTQDHASRCEVIDLYTASNI